MKQIILVLESGEEVLCGYAKSVFKYFKLMRGEKIVPMNGDKKYTVIRNLYDDNRKQYVSYKAVEYAK
jgi:hypothetical protein